MPENPLLLRPSGVNSTFHGSGGTFQDYIQHMQNVIACGRLDLQGPNSNQIIYANSPFELRPSATANNKKGILLIHGLYDSPFSLQEIGQHLLTAGFLVRSILLPGHGTVPGDLLNIDYNEWVKAAAYGIASFAKQVTELYVVAYSLGATLGLYQALQQSSIKGLVLLAPALKPQRLMAYFMNWHQFFNRSDYPDYYQVVPQKSFTKYEDYAYNAARQACRLMKKTRDCLAEKQLSIPVFVVITQDDESVSPKATINFFEKNTNPQSRLLMYGNRPTQFADSRITMRSSAFPEQKILDFSHTAIPFAPSNPHFGIKGDYHDFQHYKTTMDKTAEIYHGAISAKNLRQHLIQRLSYNPDFAGMLKAMDVFLHTI